MSSSMYWENHSDEKAALESEKSSLESQISELQKQIQALPEVTSVESIKNQIKSKTEEKNGLGLFKGKEKKAIQEIIDSLNSRLSDAEKAQETAIAPFIETVTKLQQRIAEIDTELTKDR